MGHVTRKIGIDLTQASLVTHVRFTTNMNTFINLGFLLLAQSVLGQIDESEFFDPFETDFPEWRLAFRGEAGVGQSVFAAYVMSQTGVVDKWCRKLPSKGRVCNSHYRNNDVLDNGNNIEQVAFVVYKEDQRVAQIIFNGKGTDNMNWFTEARILSSSWTDITVDHTKNYMSIHGDQETGVKRPFYINQKYHGCPDDVGWFVAVDSHDVCAWANGPSPTPTYPRFLYASKNVETNWTTGDVGEADSFLVFVKYNKSGTVGK